MYSDPSVICTRVNNLASTLTDYKNDSKPNQAGHGHPVLIA